MRRIALICFLLLGCATAGTSVAESAASAVAPKRTEPLTTELFLSLSEVRDARISPDGRWVAYELSVPQPPVESGDLDDDLDDSRTPIDPHSRQPRQEIWLVSTARPATPPRRFTSPSSSAWSPRWAPDGTVLAFLSRRADQHSEPQIYTIPIAGGEARAITAIRSGVSAFAWAPDGKSIAFLASEPETRAEKADRQAGRDWHIAGVHKGAKRLWLLDAGSIAGPVTSEMPGKLIDDLHVWGLAWAPDSKSLAISASPQPDADSDLLRRDLYRVDIVQGAAAAAGGKPGAAAAAGGKAASPTSTLTRLTRRAPAKLEGFAWSPDGQQIAFHAGVDASDPVPGSLFVMPATGGEPKNLAPDFLGSVGWVGWADARTILMASIEGTATTLRRVDTRTGTMSKQLDPPSARTTAPSGGPLTCYHPHFARDRRTYACPCDSVTHSREVCVGQVPGATGPARATPRRRVTVSNPALERVRFGAQETIQWKTPDGWEIQGIVIKPLDYQAGQKYPLVVLPHGGPEGSRENGWQGYPGQLLAARGFMAIYPNYRGSAGRGVAFAKGDHRDMGGKEFDDVLAGIDHLDRLGLIDNQRVGIGGWSYGGYFSAWGGTRHSERFAAAVMGAGISNWVSYQGSTDIPDEMAMVHWALEPYEEIDLIWDRSPLAHVASARTPMLIIHGQDDARVPVGQAWEMYRALKHRGVETELVAYPRAGHGVREYAHRQDMITRFIDWFERHLGGSASGPRAVPGDSSAESGGQ